MYRVIYNNGELSCFIEDRKIAYVFAGFMDKIKKVVAIVGQATKQTPASVVSLPFTSHNSNEQTQS